ncbi:MAG: GNAT family N-acetyltransferase [Pseudomonadota bacterium]
MPSFVEAELDRLYGNVFSSLPQLRLHDALTNVCTYVVRSGSNIITLFLFLHEKGRVRVINEGMEVGEDEASRFAGYIFSSLRNVNTISFRAIQTDVRRLAFPFQRSVYLEDIVLTLPDTEQEYLARLGKSTRSYIHRYLNKLRRSVPSFRFQTYVRDEVDEESIHAIIRLNRARMAAKGKVSGFDDVQTRKIIALVKACGFVGVATIDGRVCGGSINYCVGSNYFLEAVAHDSAYDNYRLGTLCSYLTICECIARAGKEYHFLWGQYAYKYRLLGVERDLECLVVYRSRTHVLLCCDLALTMAARGCWRQAKAWLREKAGREESVVLRPAINALYRLRGSR